MRGWRGAGEKAAADGALFICRRELLTATGVYTNQRQMRQMFALCFTFLFFTRIYV